MNNDFMMNSVEQDMVLEVREAESLEELAVLMEVAPKSFLAQYGEEIERKKLELQPKVEEVREEEQKMNGKVTREQLIDMVEKLTKQVDEMSKSRKISTRSADGQPKPKPGVKYVVNREKNLRIETPQVVALFEILKGQDKDELTEEEVFRAVEQNKGLLNTRQSAVRIFRYYRKDLIEACAIEKI